MEIGYEKQEEELQRRGSKMGGGSNVFLVNSGI
jgi:hypothetical protein